MKALMFLFFVTLPAWLYAQEICDNGLDDDGDGLIDMNDPDCQCLGFLNGVTSLIPNPSFEDTLCCPEFHSQLICADKWIQASDATTDYFNLCNFTHLSDNLNQFSPPPFPLPGHGMGYAGFYDFFGWQEMLGACLEQPLAANNAYRFSFFLASGLISGAPSLVISIYGTSDCQDLPWSGFGCPVGTGSWILLGQDTVEFLDNVWKQAAIEFTPTDDIFAVALGGPCTGVTGWQQESYYYIDELTVAAASEFDLNAQIYESGNWCNNDLFLYAVINSTGGTWQWYREGIALSGETNDTLDLMPYGEGAVYTAVYTIGGDCVSIDHSVDKEYFSDYLQDLKVSSACKMMSNGIAYLITEHVDTLSLSYYWRAVGDTTVLTEEDTLKNFPSGLYSVEIIHGVNCDTTLYFHIPEEDFRVSFEVSDTLICLGDTLRLANTSDTHFTAYHWAFDNGDTSALPDPESYVYPESGSYRLMLAGAGPVCEDTVYRTILVDQPLHPDFNVEPGAVCVGQPVHLIPLTDHTTIQLDWETEDQLWSEKAIRPQYQHAFADSGTFPITLTVQSRACPDISVTDTIRVYPLPEVDLGTDSSLCLQGQPIYLKNFRNAPLGPYHQVWNTGDTTEILKVVHPGIYTLSVTTEPTGCTTTESIEISKDCYFDIPNAFTPNGDGHNDYFLPRQLLSEGLTRFHMQVFNRWGQVVFESQVPDGRGWDGRLNGKVQPSGVYLYRIEADFSNGRQEKYEGDITLIR